MSEEKNTSTAVVVMPSSTSWTDHPMFAAMAPWIQSFARVETERDSLRLTSSKLAKAKQSAEERLGSLEKQVKDLQDKLSSQQSESKKALDDAQEAVSRRDRDLVARLSALVHGAKGHESTSTSAGTSGDAVSLESVIAEFEVLLSKTQGDLAAVTGTLCSLHAGMCPTGTVPSTAQGLAAAFGEGSSIVMDFARELTVRGSEYTLKLLLSNGAEANFDAALSDYPKKQDGKPLSFRGVTEPATRMSELCIRTMERRAEAVVARSRKNRAESVSQF